MSRSLDGVTDVVLCCPSQIDNQRLRFVFGINADSFKRQLNSFRLCSDLIVKYFQTCNPTFMLFAEDIEEAGPFITRYFSRAHFDLTFQWGRFRAALRSPKEHNVPVAQVPVSRQSG